MILQTIQPAVIQVEALSLSILKQNVFFFYFFCKDKKTSMSEKRGLVTFRLKPMRRNYSRDIFL